MIRFVLCVLAWSIAIDASAQINDADRVRIAEARRMADQFGDVVWPGWHDAPFAILLVTKDIEYLLYHDSPSQDFQSKGLDAMLGTEVFFRPRQYDPGLQATFPAVGGVPCVVIGQAPNTQASTSTRWVLTVLHEHFHQWQQSRADYYSSTQALDLDSGDGSGMWMLDYPFPYEDDALNESFLIMTKRLRIALEAEAHNDLVTMTQKYLDARRMFTDQLAEKDHRYFSFQLWQEGVARYTELRIARVAAGYAPLGAFKRLDDYTTYSDTRQLAYDHILTALSRDSLRKKKRTAFYAVGAGEGLLLDRLGATWQPSYFEKKFFIEEYFAQAPGLSR